MMEYKNLWDLENLTKCNIEDCTVMGVYCDNNYQKYTNRFLSKFNMLYCP